MTRAAKGAGRKSAARGRAAVVRRAAAPLRLQIEDVSRAARVPDAAALRRAARAAVTGGSRRRAAAMLAIRIVGSREGRALNRRYRGKDRATNVLSFPASLPAGLPRGVRFAALGDLVICAPVVAREARLQGKSTRAHWDHMVVHGVLHLLGHDHRRRAEAARMERLERRLLAALGHPDPYLVATR